MNHAEQQIRKLAIELYDQALAAGRGFEIEELVERLIADLVERWSSEDRSVLAELLEISAREAIQYVDKQRTKPTEQPTLGEDLDRSIKVGGSVRIVRRRMAAQDWARHMGFVNDNAGRVNQAAGRENRRYAALLPYLTQGMDTEAALAAWQSANPDQVLS